MLWLEVGVAESLLNIESSPSNAECVYTYTIVTHDRVFKVSCLTTLT